MTKKRTRIKSKGVMAAWSNGERVHMAPSQLKYLENDYRQKVDDYHTRVAKGYEWETDRPSVMRGESRLMEERSDRLWELDHHVESLLWLMDAARVLIDWDYVVIGPETNYHHRNLERFRYLVRRCEKRCQQDPRLSPLLANSDISDAYLDMEKAYAGYKDLGWIP